MSINNAETWPRPLLNTTCDSEQSAEGPVGRGEASKHFSLAGNYSWELFIRTFFCSVISFLCTWPVEQWAMKLQELKIKFDVNTHATWSSIENFPNWHELRHHASVRRRRGDGEGSGSQVAAMMLETGECGWSGASEGEGHVARVSWSSYITLRGRGWDEGTNDTRRQGRSGETWQRYRMS